MPSDGSDNDGPDLALFDFGDDSDDGASSAAAAKPKKKTPPAAAAAGAESAAAMGKRHRQEEQQLRTEAKAKLREIPKGDRAAKQAADDALETALAEMQARHAAELGGGADADAAAAGVAGLSVTPPPPSPPKSGKKKSKKQKAEEAERAREQRIADHHAGAGPSERHWPKAHGTPCASSRWASER